jgi:hypothetical protein
MCQSAAYSPHSGTLTHSDCVSGAAVAADGISEHNQAALRHAERWASGDSVWQLRATSHPEHGVRPHHPTGTVGAYAEGTRASAEQDAHVFGEFLVCCATEALGEVEWFQRHTGAAYVVGVTTTDAFDYTPLMAPPPVRTSWPFWERPNWWARAAGGMAAALAVVAAFWMLYVPVMLCPGVRSVPQANFPIIPARRIPRPFRAAIPGIRFPEDAFLNQPSG